MNVKEGDIVDAGEIILNLEQRNVASSGVDLDDTMEEEVNKQIEIISHQEKKVYDLYLRRMDEAKASLDVLTLRTKLIDKQLFKIEDRKLIEEKFQQGFKRLESQGLISIKAADNQQSNVIDLELEALKLKESSLQLEQEKSRLSSLLDRLPLEMTSELESLRLKKSEIITKLSNLKRGNDFAVLSPGKGKVTAINVTEGQYLRANDYMLSLIPEKGRLHVELLFPSRAIGQIEVGQKTRLKLEAFPYQKFGLIEAEIYEIEKNIVFPHEVSSPVKLLVPFYRVKAKLSSQVIFAGNKSVPLQTGMLVDADVILESRTLGEWLIEPVFKIFGFFDT